MSCVVIGRASIHGIPDWFMRGHVSKQTIWPTTCSPQIWPTRDIMRRVTRKTQRDSFVRLKHNRVLPQIKHATDVIARTSLRHIFYTRIVRTLHFHKFYIRPMHENLNDRERIA